MNRRSLALVLSVVSIVVGCGTGGSPARGPVLAVEQSSAVGDLVRVPDSPLSGISHLDVAAGGQHIALVGGFENRSDGAPEAFSDRGAVFSLADRRWIEMTLPRPLALPAAVWVGDVLLVAGAECDEPLPEEDSEAFCRDAPTVAQTYDPESEKWEDVSEGLDLSNGAIGAPTATRAVGVTADGAVFRFSGRTSEYHRYDFSTGEWGAVASPPPDTSTLCVVDQTLYAIGVPDAFGGQEGPAPTTIKIYALEPGGAHWAVTTTHDAARTGQMGNKIVCGANELAIVPMQPQPKPEIPGVLWLSDTGTLEEVPPVPVTFPGATIADLNDTHLFFPSEPVAGAYSLGGGAWRDTGLRVSTDAAHLTDSGLVLVAPFESHEPEISLLRPTDQP